MSCMYKSENKKWDMYDDNFNNLATSNDDFDDYYRNK